MLFPGLKNMFLENKNRKTYAFYAGLAHRQQNVGILPFRPSEEENHDFNKNLHLIKNRLSGKSRKPVSLILLQTKLLFNLSKNLLPLCGLCWLLPGW